MESSSTEKESFKVLNLTTEFENDVLKQLRDRCEFLGIDERIYSDMGGLQLLTTLVVRESELTKFENLTDLTVISLLESQRIALHTHNKCPYCRHKFDSNTKGDANSSDKEIHMSYMDQIYSLVTSKLGQSGFPRPTERNK